MMKKVTMLVFILALCITGISNAAPVCVQISPCDAGPDDEITLTAFDENGDQVDLTEYDGIEINFAGSGEDGFWIVPDDMVDGTVVLVLGEGRFYHNQMDFFCAGGPGDTWLPIAMPDFGEGAIFDWIPDAVAAGGTCESNSCADPTIVVGGGEVEEEGETSAVLPIQLDRNPSAPVTITIAEPVWETDPNFSDPESFTLAGAVDGVATVIIPADSNSTSITVTAIDDSAIEGNLGYGLVVESYMDPEVAGYDPNLVTGDAAVLSAGSVTVIDNDVRTVLVEPDLVELSENNPNVWVCVDVTLSHEPLAVVNVGVDFYEWAVDAGMVETDVDLEDPNALQFDATNWDTPQTICFAAIDNEELAEAGTSHIPAYAELIPSSDDPGYDPETGIDPGASITVLVEDNECGAYGWDFRDYNEDCFVTIEDYAVFAQGWMLCTDPGNPACTEE